MSVVSSSGTGELRYDNNTVSATVIRRGENAGVADPRLPSALRLLGTWPNPARGAAMVAFETPSTTRLTFALFDIAGRQVWRSEALFSAGRHVIPLDNALATIRPGAYFLRLSSPAGSSHRKLLLLR